MPDHICDKALIVEQHGRDISDLFEKVNRTVLRVGEVETTLFGAERNGGGYMKMHERLHEEEDMAIKETLEVVREGMKTIADTQAEHGKKLAKLTDRGRYVRSLITTAVAATIPAAGAVAAVLLSR